MTKTRKYRFAFIGTEPFRGRGIKNTLNLMKDLLQDTTISSSLFPVSWVKA